MFKEIVAISKNYAIVKIDSVINDDLLNLNVVFEEENKKILGEIEEVANNEVKINLITLILICNLLYKKLKTCPCKPT